MPAKSQAQRAYLNAHFGHDWVKAHHFNTTGKLPAKVGKKGKAMSKHKKSGHHKGGAGHGHKAHTEMSSHAHGGGKHKNAHSTHHSTNKAHGTGVGMGPEGGYEHGGTSSCMGNNCSHH